MKINLKNGKVWNLNTFGENVIMPLSFVAGFAVFYCGLLYIGGFWK